MSSIPSFIGGAAAHEGVDWDFFCACGSLPFPAPPWTPAKLWLGLDAMVRHARRGFAAN